jgi:hypothetical protein
MITICVPAQGSPAPPCSECHPQVDDLLAADKRTVGPTQLTLASKLFLANASYTSLEPRLRGYDAARGKLPFLADQSKQYLREQSCLRTDGSTPK